MMRCLIARGIALGLAFASSSSAQDCAPPSGREGELAKLVAQGNFEEVARAAREVLVADPSAAWAYEPLLDAQLMLGRASEHAAFIDELRREHPDIAAPDFAALDILERECRWSELASRAGEAVERHPADVRLVVAWVSATVEAGTTTDIEAILRRHAEVESAVPAWRLGLGELLARTGRLEEGRTMLMAVAAQTADAAPAIRETALLRLASALVDSDRLAEAERLYREDLAAASLGGQVARSYKLGEIAVRKSDATSARAEFRRAAQCARAAGYLNREFGRPAAGEALASVQLGDREQARQVLDRTMELARKLHLTAPFASMCIASALLHIQAGHPRDAAAAVADALEQQGEHPNRKSFVALAGIRAIVAQLLGDADEAIRIQRASVAAARGLGRTELMAEALTNLGNIHARRGEFREAIDALDEALRLQVSVETVMNVPLTRTNLAVLLQGHLGDLSAAESQLRAALAESETAGTRPTVAVVTLNLGGVLAEQGRFDEARDHLLRAVTLTRELGQRSDEATALNNLATLYTWMGDLERATEYMDLALDARQQAADVGGLALALTNFAWLQAEQGSLPSAERTLRRAASVAREGGDKERQAHALSCLSEIELDTGRPEAAVASLTDALALAREAGSATLVAWASHRLARARLAKGDIPGALAAAEEAVTLSEGSGGPTALWLSLAERGEARLAAGMVEEAVVDLNRAHATAETLRDRLPVGTSREQFTGLLAGLSENRIGALVRLGRIGEAFAALQEWKARRLLETLRAARQDVSAAAPAALRRERAALAARAGFLEDRIAAMPGGTAATSADRAELAATLEKLDESERRLVAESPAYAAATTALVRTPEAAQSLLGADTVLFDYFVGEGGGHAFRIAPGGARPQSWGLPPRKELERLVTAFSAGVRAGRDDPGSQVAGEALAAALFGPRAGALPMRGRLVLVPDGVLHSLPYDALPIPSPDGKRTQRVFERLATSYLPSISTLAEIRRRGTAQPSEIALAAFSAAEPESLVAALSASERGGSPRENVPEASVEPPAKPAAERAATATADAGPLRHAAHEVDAVHAAVRGPGRRLVFVGSEATEARFKWLDGRGARFLHVAMHAELNAKRSWRSALLLAASDAAGNAVAQDGRLEARELGALRLPIRVAVLSACDTGSGENLPGEGVVSLQRALMSAGADTVVSSLWRVKDDARLAEFWARFYRAIGNGVPRDVALQQARRWMSANAKDPADVLALWAPFVLHGETKPIGE